jgi:flagellar biosynthesis chaperone FliJ
MHISRTINRLQAVTTLLQMYQQDYQQASSCNNTASDVSAGLTIYRLQAVKTLLRVYQQDYQQAASCNITTSDVSAGVSTGCKL